MAGSWSRKPFASVCGTLGKKMFPLPNELAGALGRPEGGNTPPKLDPAAPLKGFEELRGDGCDVPLVKSFSLWAERIVARKSTVSKPDE